MMQIFVPTLMRNSLIMIILFTLSDAGETFAITVVIMNLKWNCFFFNLFSRYSNQTGKKKQEKNFEFQNNLSLIICNLFFQ